MNLLSPKTIKELLQKNETKPNKHLGQNFLIDRNVLNKIISSANLKKTDVVLEVGPGIGSLTEELAKNAGQVIAIEKDSAMLPILKETLKGLTNVQIIQADILKILTPMSFPRKRESTFSCVDSGFRVLTSPSASSRRGKPGMALSNYKVVANIPYYLTSPLIRKFLECENQPEFMVLMIQKEVAQRICASPAVALAKEGKTATRRRQGSGGRGMSLLAVSVQFYAKPEIISYVSKNCFMPAPKVDSAIIKITPSAHSVIARSEATWQSRVRDQDLFFEIVKAGFSHPRKQLSGNLSNSLKMEKKSVEEWLLKNNIQPNQRAETLSVEDWQNLAKTRKLWIT